MAINKKTLRKLTRDFIVPLGKRDAEPLSMFHHEVTQPDRKLESVIIRKKKGRKK